MSHGSSNAIISCVASADDDDIFTFGIDISTVRQFRVQQGLRIQLGRNERGHRDS